MTDRAISLDRHRGIAAQKTTELRRQLAEVEANQNALPARQNELEAQLITAPALSWCEAGEKARYLLNIFAAAPVAQDPRRQKLIAGVLEDFAVSRARMEPTHCTRAVTHQALGTPGGSHANREQSRSREKRKPNAEKPRPAVQVLPFGRVQGRDRPKSSAGKKGCYPALE